MLPHRECTCGSCRAVISRYQSWWLQWIEEAEFLGIIACEQTHVILPATRRALAGRLHYV